MSVCPGCGLAVAAEATLTPGGLLHCEVCGRLFPLVAPAASERPSDAPGAAAAPRPAAPPVPASPPAAADGSLLGLSLTVVKGPAVGRKIDVEGREIVFGRTMGDVRIEDPEISRRHAKFLIVGGRCQVRDLGSTNGIFVNGVRVSEAIVATGQEVTIGHTVLRLDELRGVGRSG